MTTTTISLRSSTSMGLPVSTTAMFSLLATFARLPMTAHLQLIDYLLSVSLKERIQAKRKEILNTGSNSLSYVVEIPELRWLI